MEETYISIALALAEKVLLYFCTDGARTFFHFELCLGIEDFDQARWRQWAFQ